MVNGFNNGDRVLLKGANGSFSESFIWVIIGNTYKGQGAGKYTIVVDTYLIYSSDGVNEQTFIKNISELQLVKD